MRKIPSAIIAVTILATPALAEGKRPFTIDDMLRSEEIGKVRFDGEGQKLIFERYGPLDRQTNFSHFLAVGLHRSKLFVADLASDSEPQPLFDQDADNGYTLLSISPGGEWIAYRRMSTRAEQTHAEHIGVISAGGGQTRQFAFAPGIVSSYDERWAGHLLPYAALPPGETRYASSLRPEWIDRLGSKWRDAQRGNKSTESVLGSGRYFMQADRGELLALADPRSGKAQRLGSGRFTKWIPSPDGKMLATLRQERLSLGPVRLLEAGANFGGIRSTLLVYDLSSGGAPTEVCKGCDVLGSQDWSPTSLNWSPGGRYLAFVSRAGNAGWAQAHFHVFDVKTRRTRLVNLSGLMPHFGRAGYVALDIRSAWLGERLAVLAAQAALDAAPLAPTTGRDERADWYLLGTGQPVNLTAGFEGKTPELIATAKDGFVLLHEGKAWLVNAAGARRDLAPQIAEGLAEWRQPSYFGPGPRENLQPIETLILQKEANTGAASHLFFIDLKTGKVECVIAPSMDAKFVAASTYARRAAVVEIIDNATILSVVSTHKAPRRIVQINPHLNEVIAATPQRIDHKGPNGDNRHSWMLLPPGYSGGRLPTVVNVYPGALSGETYSRSTVNQVHAFNDQILTARGYAVLYPSIPVNYETVPRDPMYGLDAEVFAATDAAVAAGYADDNRLALQGHSYGGYTTAALIGLTGRFKAAVAQAGVYDLVSFYGTFDVRRWQDVEFDGLDLYGVSWAETSAGGMGAPPWKDPERYLRNSPLMHVEKVTTPIMLIHGDRDFSSMTQAEEYFTALTRLDKDAVFVRYWGEDHVFNSPANIRDMWARIFAWYELYLGPL